MLMLLIRRPRFEQQVFRIYHGSFLLIYVIIKVGSSAIPQNSHHITNIFKEPTFQASYKMFYTYVVAFKP